MRCEKMTTENIMKQLQSYINTMGETDRNYINARQADGQKTAKSGLPACILADLMIDLKADLQAKAAKNSGKSNQLTAVKRIVKNTPERMSYCNKYIPYDGKSVFCDGYRFAILNDSFGYEPDEKSTFNINAIINPCKAYSNEIQVDIADVKMFLKMQKINRPKQLPEPYIIENETIKIGFNPQYLIDMIEIIGTDKIKVNSPASAGYLENKATEEYGIVMPVKINK